MLRAKSTLARTALHLDGATQAALSTYEPIAFVGKPFLPVALRRAMEMAGGN